MVVSWCVGAWLVLVRDGSVCVLWLGKEAVRKADEDWSLVVNAAHPEDEPAVGEPPPQGQLHGHAKVQKHGAAPQLLRVPGAGDRDHDVAGLFSRIEWVRGVWVRGAARVFKLNGVVESRQAKGDGQRAPTTTRCPLPPSPHRRAHVRGGRR